MVSLFKGHLCIKLGLSPQERGQKAEAALISKPKRSRVKMRKVATDVLIACKMHLKRCSNQETTSDSEVFTKSLSSLVVIQQIGCFIHLVPSKFI